MEVEEDEEDKEEEDEEEAGRREMQRGNEDETAQNLTHKQFVCVCFLRTVVRLSCKSLFVDRADSPDRFLQRAAGPRREQRNSICFAS